MIVLETIYDTISNNLFNDIVISRVSLLTKSIHFWIFICVCVSGLISGGKTLIYISKYNFWVQLIIFYSVLLVYMAILLFILFQISRVSGMEKFSDKYNIKIWFAKHGINNINQINKLIEINNQRKKNLQIIADHCLGIIKIIFFTSIVSLISGLVLPMVVKNVRPNKKDTDQIVSIVISIGSTLMLLSLLIIMIYIGLRYLFYFKQTLTRNKLDDCSLKMLE